MVALQHPLAETYLDMPPTELVECLFACPALSVKYVEVSCKTNHQIHHFERILLRSLRLLSLAEQGRAATARTDGLGKSTAQGTSRVGKWPVVGPLADALGAGALLDGVSSSFNALVSQTPECFGVRKQM